VNKAIQEFEQRYNEFNLKSINLKKRHTNLSWARVITFLIAILLFVSFANNKVSEGLVITGVVFLIVFFLLLKKHIAVKREKEFQEELANINAEEIKRSNGDLSGFDKGEDFIDPIHSYHIDLDIFGKNSLFQLLNRTSTRQGRSMFSQWLSKPEGKELIQKRNAAVNDLGPKIDWRQNFEAFGRTFNDERDGVQDLLDWLKEPNSILPKKFYRFAVIFFPIATVAVLLLWAFGVIPMSYISLVILINMVVLGSVQKQAKDIFAKTVKGNQALKALKNQIALIENETFDSALMTGLKGHFNHDNLKASSSLKELQLVLDSLLNRANLLYWPLNIVFQLDLITLILAEKWKEKTKADVEKWFTSIGEIECLNSLAGFHYANPDYSFPVISEQPFTIVGESVGHPLIKPGKRISNDFNFSRKGGICLITGSNMSGKSTFLRTVGLNAVLALMGAPVCAKTLKISNLQVFTSMRTEDDLEESVSSFYAELKRLKQLLGSINSEVPVMFMIDEVLKGTNSEDRHKGASALIRQLNKAQAFGFVSTHDIELGKITNELQGVKNYSFNSLIEGDEIIFDYTLTEGICKSFNATKLMQLMGIEIIE
jgi:Ca2+/Na+ antiporter